MSKILYLHVKGGAPVDHAFPRIAACGELHVLALMPLPAATEDEWRPHCASVAEWPEVARGEELVDLVAEYAGTIGADAVLALSEFAALLVAHVADRLGLAGAGAGAIHARDKRLMREIWSDAGVAVPAFRRVDTEDDLHAAMAALTPPVLLKPAWGAGSVAQLVLTSDADVAPAWQAVAGALRKGGQAGWNELYHPDTDSCLLVEEIVDGDAGKWYEEPGYGDYVSVEGIVAGGVYHPLCITGRLPPIPPFTEVASTAPAALPVLVQRRIEELSRRAVDALGLDTCGTHTEIKLGADGKLVVIETAARFGGVMITREVEDVFGLDPITMLVRQLLGEHVEYPETMLVAGDRAVASLAVTPAGWSTTPVWDPDSVDWATMLSAGSTIESVKAFATPAGRRVARYDPSAGASNWLGVLLVTAKDAGTLLADCNAVLNGLEAALAE